MKILYSSNAPWVPSGYGNQSKLLINYLKQHHEIAFLTNFGITGGNVVIDDVLYLAMDSNYCNKTIKYASQQLKPDLILSLADWFVFEYDEWGGLGVPWVNWTPIDSKLTKICQRMKTYTNSCEGVVAMSQFGYDEISRFKKPTGMIYHALDANIYRIMDKEEARKMHSLPNDAFIIGLVMANQSANENRKAYDLQIEAISKFIKKNPDLNVMLYFHTVYNTEFQGRDLVALLAQNDVPLDRVIFTNTLRLHLFPFYDEKMVALFNSFDVLMNASSGEGFGVPIIEAQACGVPVLTHNFTAMPEITFYGYAAKSNKSNTRTIEGYGHRYMPSVPDMVNGLQYILENRDEKKRQEASKLVRETFDIQRIGKQWLDIIEGIGADTQVAKGVGL